MTAPQDGQEGTEMDDEKAVSQTGTEVGESRSEGREWTIHLHIDGETSKFVEGPPIGINDAPVRVVPAEEVEGRLVTGAIPTGEITKDTEFVFIAGQAFVNAGKHEEVVDAHVGRAAALDSDASEFQAQTEAAHARAEKAEAHLEAIRARCEQEQDPESLRPIEAVKFAQDLLSLLPEGGE